MFLLWMKMRFFGFVVFVIFVLLLLKNLRITGAGSGTAPVDPVIYLLCFVDLRVIMLLKVILFERRAACAGSVLSFYSVNKIKRILTYLYKKRGGGNPPFFSSSCSLMHLFFFFFLVSRSIVHLFQVFLHLGADV